MEYETVSISQPTRTHKPARRRPRLTGHAVERYHQRVNPTGSLLMARSNLAQMVARGRIRSTPRHWMRGHVAPTPGLRFLYWAELPGVCALLLGDAVVTILTRQTCNPRSATEWLPVDFHEIASTQRWRCSQPVSMAPEAA